MLAGISLSGNSRRYVLALIAAAILGAAILLAYLLWSSHRDALAGAERNTRNYAWLLEASFDAALRHTDANLKELAETMPAEALTKTAVPSAAARFDRELDRHMRHFPELDALHVYDAAGDMLYASAGTGTRHNNIADRPYFQRLRDDPQAGLVFSEVLIARATGRPAIIAARAIYTAGRFAGVVTAPLNLAHFQDLFKSVEIGRQGLIAVRRSDDFTLVLRRPMLENEINLSLPPHNPLVRAVAEGKRMETVRFYAQTDGIERIFSIRTLQSYPYYVIVGLATEEVLAGWRIRSLGTGLFGILLLGLLGFVLVRLVASEAHTARIVGDLARSSRRLMESEERLDAALAIARMAEWEYDIDDRRFLLNDRFFRVLNGDAGSGGYLLAAADFSARFVDPQDAPLFAGMLHRATAEFDSGKTWEEHLRLRCGDSPSRWMLMRFRRVPPSRDGGGRLFAGTLLDIHERHESEQARRRLAGLQTAILEAAGYSIIATTPEGAITLFNKAAERMLGYRAEEMIGRQTPAVIHDAAEVAARAQQFSAELGVTIETGFEVFVVRSRRQLPNTYEWTYIRKDGSRFPVLLSVTALRDEDGVIAGFLGIAADMTERKQAEQRLQLLAGVFQHSGEPLMITDHDNRIVEVNPAFTRQTGYRADEVRGRSPRMLSAGRTPPETYQAMWAAIRANGFWQGEIWDRRKDGGIYPKLLTITVVTDSAGAISHHIASFADITQQKATEERIRHLALHDPLTGLPNRLDLKGRLEQALAAARRDRHQVAVMFLDLDRFKQINDSLGHKVGDLLLIEVAQRLMASVRDSDIVARLGGDEFVVVLPNVLNRELATRMADKILGALDQPYLLESHQVESSPSIGIALFPADGEDDETLLKRADEAMYRAKALGRNNWQFFAA